MATPSDDVVLENPAVPPVPVVLTAEHRRRLEDEGAAAYPNECCGILHGHDEPGRRVVGRVEAVDNGFASGEQYHRFSITPAALMLAERACRPGELIVGFYHSHPDHPARPSPTDLLHAWPFYSYVIVGIHGGRPADLTSWVLDEATERFAQQPVG